MKFAMEKIEANIKYKSKIVKKKKTQKDNFFERGPLISMRDAVGKFIPFY